MNKSVVRKYGTLLLLACGPAFIFTIPYLRESFYVPMMKAMNLTNAQMGMLMTVHTACTTPSYLIGGILADKFPPRIMLTFSLVSTGLLGFWYASFPSYTVCLIIFALMGFTTVMTFWSAVLKAVRMLGTPEEQGRLYGLHEGVRGFLNAGLVFAMAYVYGKYTDNILGTQAAVRLCAGLLIVLGILCFIFIDKGKGDQQSEPLKDIIVGMAKCMKIPRVWLLVGINFFGYTIYALMSYVNAYAVEYCGLSEVASANLGGVRYLMQGVGGVVGGFLADKIGSRLKVIIGTDLLLAIAWAALIFIPGTPAYMTIVLANFLLGVMLVYTLRSLYFSDISEAKLDLSITGRVSGLMSTIGYLPDVFILTITGGWIDRYAQNGYKMIFGYAAVCALISGAFALALLTVVKKSNKENITV